MEHHGLKDFTIDLFQRCCTRINFQAGLAMTSTLGAGRCEENLRLGQGDEPDRDGAARQGAYWDRRDDQS